MAKPNQNTQSNQPDLLELLRSDLSKNLNKFRKTDRRVSVPESLFFVFWMLADGNRGAAHLLIQEALTLFIERKLSSAPGLLPESKEEYTSIQPDSQKSLLSLLPDSSNLFV